MMPSLRLVLIACALVLTACSGGAKPTSIPTGSTGAIMLGEIPPRALRPDQCSLILLTRTEPAMRVLFATDRPAEATARIGGRDIVFQLADQSGAQIMGHAERQTWRAPSGATLMADVRFEPVAGDSGAAIRSASLSYTSPDGETLVTPVIGALACGAAAR